MVTYPTVMAEAVVRLILRLPPSLHAALSAWAKEERRSLNGHIVYLLEQAVRNRRGG